ncbi:MAG TPA: hypothetical protein VNK04_00725 [Gemmataceae bacterium]|nr:hypothetical protein [Gemmataceae bacterium]
MKQTAVFLLVLTAGCSTAPVADLLDHCKPGRIGPGPYYGGVCAPHTLPGAAPVPVPPPPAVPLTDSPPPPAGPLGRSPVP